MFFKNLQIYRLPAPWAVNVDQLADALTPYSFVPCTSMDLQRQGWASPRNNGQLVHAVNKQMLIVLRTEKKLLPASVINQVTKARAIEMEEAQGFAPGRKAMKELKERIADELLPRAFGIESSTQVWIDPINGWLVIDAASPSKADEVVKQLLKAIDKLPLESLRVQRSPVAVMTEWLSTDEAPAGFTIDQDAEMRATGEGRATVRYVRHTLEADDVRRHIAAGKQCTRLAMTWNDKISFVLTEDLAIKSVKALDVIKESESSTKNDDERFDSDMALMTGELSQMMADLVEALGGEASVSAPAKDNEPSREHHPVLSLHDHVAGQLAARGLEVIQYSHTPANGDTPADGEQDDLYNQAVAVVRTNRRASISLVQRNLTIGYNRAARLMDAMEAQGVISAMESNGERTVLAEPGAGAGS